MNRTICLDAGHGGADNGASKNQIVEDTFNLDMITRIGHHLRLKGLKTILTRETDTFISINRRAYIARKAKASLYLSLHCNAAASTSAQGAEVFYAAGDDKSKLLAEKILRHLPLLKIRGAKPDNRSQHSSLGVLRGTWKYMEFGSILVELGFCTNKHDAELMRDKNQREEWAVEIATVIASAVNV